VKSTVKFSDSLALRKAIYPALKEQLRKNFPNFMDEMDLGFQADNRVDKDDAKQRKFEAAFKKMTETMAVEIMRSSSVSKFISKFVLAPVANLNTDGDSEPDDEAVFFQALLNTRQCKWSIYPNQEVVRFLKSVCETHDISIYQLLGKSRCRALTPARQIAVHKLTLYFGWPEVAVAPLFSGRDRTTILFYKRCYQKKLDEQAIARGDKA